MPHSTRPPLPQPVMPEAQTKPSRPAGPVDGERHRWVPIRALAARHRARILSHLLTLSEHDRYLRFGSVATEAQMAHYVDRIDFDGDDVFGIFNRKLELLAVSHLAFSALEGHARLGASSSAEFGVSVVPLARGRGYGARLFERAVLDARNRGVERLVIHALAENQAMLNIARKAGATVVRDGSESQAELMLPPDDVATHVEALVTDAVGEIDFHLKARAKAVSTWLASMGNVSSLELPRDQASRIPTSAESAQHALRSPTQQT